MSSTKPFWEEIDVSVQVTKFVDGGWKIDLVVTHLPGMYVNRIAYTSGERGEPLSQRKWAELLGLIGGLVDSTVTQLVEPF
jgi:hypothetical protein